MELEGNKKILENHENRIKKLEKNMPKRIEESEIKKTISIGEFILEANSKDDVERTVTVGYFLEHNLKYPCFNAKDIESYFRKAKEKVPNNVNDKINQCIKKRWMDVYPDKKDGKKAFVLTRTGEGAVQNKFQKAKEERK